MTKCHRLEGLKTRETYFFTVLEARSLRPGCQHGSVLELALFQVANRQFLLVSSSGGKRTGELHSGRVLGSLHPLSRLLTLYQQWLGHNASWVQLPLSDWVMCLPAVPAACVGFPCAQVYQIPRCLLSSSHAGIDAVGAVAELSP